MYKHVSLATHPPGQGTPSPKIPPRNECEAAFSYMYYLISFFVAKMLQKASFFFKLTEKHCKSLIVKGYFVATNF